MRKITKTQSAPAQPVRRKRTAAYARVSSGKDAMLHSLSAQISYYNAYIQKRGDLEFAGIYADEALTGTKDARPAFQRMLADCEDGKIDRIITKSITRFSRNTVTLLETVRRLKLLGVDIFFEKENIHTLSADGEFMITLLASYAQEESRSVSENQKWRIRRMFKQGWPNTGRMLGYRLRDGKLHIIPKEADIVRRVFAEYLAGKGRLAIAKGLNAGNIPTINGGHWRESTILGILRNEKYTGDMLLQKTYVFDPITKKKRVNRGELPMYHVENSHEAIIDKDTFDQVQRLLSQSAVNHSVDSYRPIRYPFTGIIHCGICGTNYRRKHANAGSKYEKIVWICGTFNSLGKSFCDSRQIPESILTQKAAEVLGLADFDAVALAENITRIDVVSHNQLRFLLRDRQTVDVEWENPSRRESWTPEMKQAARERQLRIQHERRPKE